MAERRTILITGASRGIGRAVALALAAPDTRFILAARTVEALEAVAAEVQSRGGEAVIVPCDVTAEPHVRRLVETAAGDGAIDVVVHSVGGALVQPFDQIGLADWEAALRVQLTSLFLVFRHSVAHMGTGGLLVQIGSVAAKQAFPGWAAYCAAKHGAQGFVGAVREELRSRGIRVSTILPAATDTELWDAIPGEWNRSNMLRPAEVAEAVATLVNSPPHVTVEELTVGHVAGRL